MFEYEGQMDIIRRLDYERTSKLEQNNNNINDNDQYLNSTFKSCSNCVYNYYNIDNTSSDHEKTS